LIAGFVLVISSMLLLRLSLVPGKGALQISEISLRSTVKVGSITLSAIYALGFLVIIMSLPGMPWRQ